MASYVKFQSFVEKLAEKVHNLGSDTLTVALTTNANAPANTDDVLKLVMQIAAHGRSPHPHRRRLPARISWC